MIHYKKQKLDLWIVLKMKDKDRFDVLNPFNGDIVESVINMSRSQVHEVLGKSLDFQCKLSTENRSEVLLKTAEYLK